MKRFLAVLMALTMLVSMFNIVAFASGEEVSPLGATTTVAGGKWANPLVKEDITVNTCDSTGTVSVNGNAMTYTPVYNENDTGTNNLSATVSVAGEAWKNTGSAEICATVSYGGTLNAGDRFAMNVAFTSYNASNARQWVTGAPSFEKDFTFASGETKNIKWVVEFGGTNLVTREYEKSPDENEWTYVRTVTKVGPTDEAYEKINQIYPYGQFNYDKGQTSGAYAVFSDFAVRELYNVAKLENITDSYDMINDDFADISYIIPSNYDKAELTIGGKVFAEFDNATNDYGAYKTTVDLSALPYFGTLPVELVIIDNNGSVITKTTTLNVTNPNDRELIASTDFDGNDVGMTFAYTADHVKPNGKTGNGISVTNMDEYDETKFYPITGGNNAIQLNNVKELKGYVYDIEFDVYETAVTANKGGKTGTIVKNWYNNGTSNVTGWKTGGWKWIQDHTSIAGTIGKFTLDSWQSMKYSIDTVNSTLSAYNMATGELLGTWEYVNDGIDYMGLGYAVYDAVKTAIQIDNVKVYRYLPGNKTGITSVAVDPVTKAISITSDTALSEENVTDANVTLTVNGNAKGVTVALAEDGKTIIVTPSAASALSGEDALVTLDSAVIGYGAIVPVSYVADYSNRKITADEDTSKVTASVDIIADAAGEDAGIMYIAYYKNGNLVHTYKTDVVTTAAGLGTFTANYTPEERVDYDTVKTFVWNSSNTPLLKVYSK